MTIRQLLGMLPPRLPAALFIALHRRPVTETAPRLPDILAADSFIPTHRAVNGERIRHGQAYVAPPDMHLLVDAASRASSTARRRASHDPASMRSFARPRCPTAVVSSASP